MVRNCQSCGTAIADYEVFCLCGWQVVTGSYGNSPPNTDSSRRCECGRILAAWEGTCPHVLEQQQDEEEWERRRQQREGNPSPWTPLNQYALHVGDNAYGSQSNDNWPAPEGDKDGKDAPKRKRLPSAKPKGKKKASSKDEAGIAPVQPGFPIEDCLPEAGLKISSAILSRSLKLISSRDEPSTDSSKQHRDAAMMQVTLMANILAMPSSLRPVLIEAVFSNVTHHRFLSTAAAPRTTTSSSPSSSAPRALAFAPSASHDGPSGAAPIPAPSSADLRPCNKLFLDPPPRFLYSAPRFLNVPVNTRIPEVCILGRSNVGKSTLINALAGVDASRAGRSHGAGSKRAGLAITSAKAGCTKMMNAYGFGPPMRAVPVPKVVDEDGGLESRSLSRKERREAKDRREKPPAHSLIMMDMPGYGLNSRVEWGAEIQKYLARRAMLRGAVVLIDAVAGVKDGDRMVLGLLRDADVRTTVVLTKADKVIFASGRDGGGQSELEGQCRRVWEELRRIEKDSLSWTEGKGWNRQIWVTGAGDPKYGGMGVDGARLAICQMLGFAKNPDFEVEAVRSVAPTSGRIIPFEQLNWPAQGAPARPPQILKKAPETPAATLPARGRSRAWKRGPIDAIAMAAQQPRQPRLSTRASF